MVDELRAVVGVQTSERKGEVLANVVDGGADTLLAMAPDRLQLRPASCDIDGTEGR